MIRQEFKIADKFPRMSKEFPLFALLREFVQGNWFVFTKKAALASVWEGV
jgi:hypothetical protein